MDQAARLLFIACIFTTAALLARSASAAQPAQAAAAVSELLHLRPGEWRELPDTRMSSVFPREDKTTWGVIGPKGVVIAWGGAAYDTKRNAFVFNGGGHTDYGGNEVYAFFLEELKWQRLTEPSPMQKQDSGQYVTTDNTPVSAHTYDGLEYLQNVDRIFRNGGAEWQSGRDFDRSAWLFDIQQRRWERKSAGGGGYVTSAYDPKRGTVYVIGNTSVEEYDPVRDVWTTRVAGQASFRSDIGAIDPENRRLVTNSYQAGVIVYDIGPNGSLSQRIFAATRGATEWDKAMAALEYDPVRKVLVGWAGGRETAYLDGKTLVWHQQNNAQSASAPVRAADRDFPASGAIYGRWRYVPKYDVFIGYNNPLGNVWVWKPATITAGSADTRARAPAVAAKP